MSTHAKVLVVEDDPGILRTVADNLRFEQYEVFTATDGETAYVLHHRQYRDTSRILDEFSARHGRHIQKKRKNHPERQETSSSHRLP